MSTPYYDSSHRDRGLRIGRRRPPLSYSHRRLLALGRFEVHWGPGLRRQEYGTFAYYGGSTFRMLRIGRICIGWLLGRYGYGPDFR